VKAKYWVDSLTPAIRYDHCELHVNHLLQKPSVYLLDLRLISGNMFFKVCNISHVVIDCRVHFRRVNQIMGTVLIVECTPRECDYDWRNHACM